MSCATMLPSSFVQKGVKADEAKDAKHRAINADAIAAARPLNPGALAGAPGNNGRLDAALIESILAQEQQRRRALLLAASSPLSSAASPVSALLAAKHQQALLFGNSLEHLTPFDRLMLMSQGGGASPMGGLNSSLFAPAMPGAGHAGLLVGQQFRGGFGTMGQGNSLNMLSTPSALVLAAQQQREQQQAALALYSGAQEGARQFSNDQLLLDAMEQGGRKGRTGTFPQKLHQMLSDIEKEEGGTDIASYLPHGHAFAIHNPSEFVQKIMPKYFRMSRFSSFQRQLNLYEFNRIADGPDKGAYFHDLFHRGRPVLASQIRRNKIKGDGTPTEVKKDRLPLFSGGQGGSAVTSLLSGGARGGTPAMNATALPPPVPPTKAGGADNFDAAGLARLVAAAGTQQAAPHGAQTEQRKKEE